MTAELYQQMLMIPSNAQQVPIYAAAGGEIAPNEISSLVAWYKADAGVYSDAGTTPATDTQGVQQWNDQSGVANVNMSQATSGNRPTYQATGLNGRKTLNFAIGSVQYMRTATDAFPAPNDVVWFDLSVFIVAQFSSSTANFGRFVSFLGTAQVNDYDNIHSFAISRTGATQSVETARNNLSLLAPAGVVYNTPQRYGFVLDSSADVVSPFTAMGTTYVNNVAGTTQETNTLGCFNNGTLCVGELALTATALLDGKISEICIFQTALSTAERLGLDNYFKTKWGLT